MSRPGSPDEQPMSNQEERRSSKRIAVMIKETPSKFRKMYVKLESYKESSSSSETEVSSPIHIQLVIDGEFSPAFKDCLANLAAYVEHPNDILSLMNASPCFKKVLPDTRKNSALWSHALPTLFEKKHLSKGGALACRLANKEVKTAVDDALDKLQPPWMYDAYSFDNADAIQDFLNQVDGTTSNIFISSILHVEATDVACFERAVELLTRYGHHLHYVNFELHFMEASDLLQGRLVRVLTLIPNVKSLYVGIQGCWQPQPRQEMLPPSLHSLTKLKIYRIPQYGGQRVSFLTGFFHRLVQMHEKQLTRFACDHYLFENIPLNELETPFANLKHLEISRRCITDLTEYRMLSNIQGLKIRSLYLSGQVGIPYNHHTVLALNHLSNTLRELRMDSFGRYEYGPWGIDPRDLKELPKLKRLTVDAYDDDSGLWHVFRHQFINMEHLRFQRPRTRARMPPTPDAEMRDRFFWTFPKLKTISWGNEDENPRVFKRE